MISFGTIALIYSVLASTTTIFYRNKSTEELSHSQRNVLYGRATLGDRFGLFFGNLLSSLIFPPVYITATLITLIAWLFS